MAQTKQLARGGRGA